MVKAAIGSSDQAGAALVPGLVLTAKALREALEHRLAQVGASLPIWVVLRALSDVGCVSQSELASHVHLEGATITHHIDRVEALGLVVREHDPGDRRVRRLRLTPAGEALHARLLDEVGELERVATAGLRAVERAALVRTLELMRQNLAASDSGEVGGELRAGVSGRARASPSR